MEIKNQKFLKILSVFQEINLEDGRMSTDTSLKDSYQNQSIIIITGELKPEFAQSRLARMLCINLDKDTINLSNLSCIQNNTEKLSFAMMQYIKWIINNLDKVLLFIEEKFNELKNIENDNVHGRTKEATDVLKIGFMLFLKFMCENEIITEEQETDLIDLSNTIFEELMSEQQEEIVFLNPIEMFYDAIEEMFATNQIKVLTYPNANDIPGTGGTKVGYYYSATTHDSDDYYYFFPGITYQKVVDYYKKKDSKFPINDKTLWKYLFEENLLYRTDKTRYTVCRTVQGVSQKVVAIKIRNNIFDKHFTFSPRTRPPTNIFDDT